jgi:hypothetical protein
MAGTTSAITEIKPFVTLTGTIDHLSIRCAHHTGELFSYTRLFTVPTALRVYTMPADVMLKARIVALSAGLSSLVPELVVATVWNAGVE